MRQQQDASGLALRAAVFLDRDGTMIVEKKYLSDPDLVEFEIAAIEGMIKLQELGFVLVGVTNQSGVGRGYFDISAVEAVNARIDSVLAQHGIEILGWFVCPHTPADECSCRKPRPGLLHRAADMFGLDLQRSWVIGDKSSDVLLAEGVGAGGILVATGYGKEAANWAIESKRAFVKDIKNAADLIFGKMSLGRT